MDEREYRTLGEALAEVPDPRQKRGQRYPWSLLLTLIAAAVVSGERNGHGIGQWVREHAEQLGELLGRPGAPLPSEATRRRALRTVDPAALEQRLGRFAAGLATEETGTGLRGQAIDGKEVRGTRPHGRVVHPVALARHDGVVLDQAQVPGKSNEIAAVPQLLAGRDLTGTVTTMDALRSLAQQIRDQGGHYLLVAKDNQPETAAAIATLFAAPPWLPGERAREYAVYRRPEKGHGRLETRTLETSPALNDWLAWPDVGQVLKRTCRRVEIRTGATQEAVTYGVTSLPPAEADAARVEGFWRGHWAIENRVHYVRDATLGEDAGDAYTGNTPRVLAALRHGLLSLLRALGWTRIADALRHYGARVERALTLIGALPARL